MNEKLTKIKAALRHAIELSDAATPGPWKQNTIIQTWIESNGLHVATIPTAYDGDWSPNNAAFIAHARTMLPAAAKALLVAIEGLELNSRPSFGKRQQADAQHALETICREWPEETL